MTMWREVRRAAALAVVASAVGGAPGAAQENPFRWSGQLSSGQVIEVKGISGNIRAERASGNTAEVVAEKTGRSRDFDRVEIRFVQQPDGITVCAVYRPERYDSDDCDLDHRDRRGRDRGHDDDIHVGVDYVVKVPAGIEFIGTIVSGDVEAVDLRSDVTATSVSGDIFVSTSGVARANTVSGSIDVAMGSLDWTRLDFKTVSGDITLRLPEAFAADVEFESLSGDIDSDFDMRIESTRRRRWVGGRVNGTIGDGGDRRLTLSTVSGDARLLKAR